jgi:glutathione S-transferase
MLPILYSYRRCPYAMRARMALKLAAIEVEIREISLRDKPAHMLQVSPKATVPVLVLQDGSVIDESLAIMEYALKQSPLQANTHVASRAYDFNKLVLENDTSFKQALDAYKYPERHPNKAQMQHRADGEVFLQKLENLLQQKPYLFGETPSFADYAIFPFIRQFAAVDTAWFEASAYIKLQAWLNNLVNSEVFVSVMQKQPTFNQ